MRRRVNVDTEHFRLDMSLRLVVSLAIGLIMGASGAVTWAYSFGKEMVATADAHRTQALTAYPTWPQVVQTIREERLFIERANEARHQEIMQRLERIEDRLMKR